MTRQNSLMPLTYVTGAAMLAGSYLIFFWVPTEEFSGVVQRLFYIHVPSAWIAYLAFAVVLIGSIGFLASRSLSWDLLARSSAEVGVVFTGITLLTGMTWGRPVWGTYWQWEPRLTMTLVLFLIYVGYLVVRATVIDADMARRISAVIGIAGFAVVPLVHFSVTWWRSLHPAGVVNPATGANLTGSMLLTLLFMVGVFTLLYALLLALRARIGRIEERVLTLEAEV